MSEPDDAGISRPTISGRVAALAVLPGLPWVLSALCVLLVLPSLSAGYSLDDYVHQNILSGKAEAHGPLSPYGLFVFVDGDPSRVRAMIDAGTLPWWTLDTLKISFWRPLAELTHGLDHALGSSVPALAHAQTLLWAAALVLLATLLYREVHGVVPAAGFAAMAFALDEGHAFSLIWVAGRNALVAGTLAIAALLCHVRGCRRGWQAGAVLGPALFVVALLAAEAALAILAYLVAYQWVYSGKGSPLQRRGAAARFGPLLPYVAIALVYLVAYRALGYGVHGSGQYLDPVGQLGSYMILAPSRALLLLAAQFVTLPLALETLHYRDEVAWAIFVVAAAVIVWAVVRALIVPHWKRPEMRFWVIGMLLSLPPALSLGAFTRALMFVGIGGAGVLGTVFAHWCESAKPDPGRWSQLGRRSLVAMHLILAPLALFGMSLILPRAMGLQEEALDQLPWTERPTWVFVNPRAAFWAGGNIQASRRHADRSVPAVRVLASGALGVTVTRSSESCLEVSPRKGYLFLTHDRLFRHPQEVMPVGWRRELPGMSVEVLERMPDGRPKTARSCFDRALEDPSLRWIAMVEGHPEIFRPPAIGETVSLDP